MARDVSDKVLSDVHVFTPYDKVCGDVVGEELRAVGIPELVEKKFFDASMGRGRSLSKDVVGHLLSRFYFNLPESVNLSNSLKEDESSQDIGPVCSVDDDGDLQVVRRPVDDNKCAVTIEHTLETQLEDVGLQVWQGCLLLCDHVLHLHAEFKDKCVVDLGAGVGLTSVVAGLFANSVIVTDTGEAILKTAKHNISLNEPLLGHTCEFQVTELDWCDPKLVSDSPQGGKMRIERHFRREINEADILLAAEVIYDKDLTDAFFSTVQQIMTTSKEKTLYISLEKRLVFTIEDLDVASPAYDHFRNKMSELTASTVNGMMFTSSKLPCDFPQYFEYERHKYLELWEIRSYKPN